jgi:archaellum biogenesis ATPase FlaH/transposase
MQTTGETPTFNYSRKPQLTTRKKEIILPTFSTMTIKESFEKAKASITNQKNFFGDLITVGDLTILFGRSNTGKSFLAFQIAEAIASGKNVLDVLTLVDNTSSTKYYNLNNQTEAQPVIYFDFEATVEKNYNRYRKANNEPYQFNSNLFLSYPEKLAIDDPTMFIDAMGEETTKAGAKVVIIDNLSAISIDNEKSGNAGKLMSKLRDYQRAKNLTVIILAHTPKVYENQPITENNLAGSKNLFNLADSVIAINTTTQGNNIRYIKQLKSKFNEKAFESDNVITIRFTEGLTGLKGYDFLGYNEEEALIKAIEKTQKEEEQEEIINLVTLFNMSYSEIAKELQPKYGKDVDLKTFRERIAKQIQRMKAKGLIKEETQPQKPATIEPQKPEASQQVKKRMSEALTPAISTIHESAPAISTPANNPILERQREREKAEKEQEFNELMKELQELENNKAI